MPRVYARQQGYVTEKTAKRGTLCWDCQNACNSGCSWSRSFKPVKGWTATPTTIDCGTRTRSGKRFVMKSFFVHKCPEFIKIQRNEPPPPKWYERYTKGR